MLSRRFRSLILFREQGRCRQLMKVVIDTDGNAQIFNPYYVAVRPILSVRHESAPEELQQDAEHVDYDEVPKAKRSQDPSRAFH
jgi:hypothetical protein